MSLQDYQPLAVVSNMHRTPRFGHTSSIAVLASTDEQEKQDYIKGIKAFSIFLIILVSTWLCVLLLLKYALGHTRVGCAAGGRRIDVTEMREQKISRSKRRQAIVRNWRVRNVFMFSTLLLPALCFVFINQGLTPFIQSLEAVLELNKTVRAKAFRGLEIAQGLETNRQTLSNIPENFQTIRNQVAEQCPNIDLTAFAISDEVQSVLQEITAPSLVLTSTEQSLFQVTNGTTQVTQTVAWINSKDWWLKLLLLAINIVNCFFVLGAFLVKIGVDYYAFQLILAYFFLPFFALLMLGSVIATGISASGAILNADFCSGSPMRTFQEVIVEQGYAPTSFVYRTVDFYVKDCTTENPLKFLRRLEAQAAIAADDLLSLASKAGSLNATDFSLECNGANLFLNETKTQLKVLAQDLGVAAGYLRAADDLTECSSISPVLRAFAYGASCTDTVESLTWMFATMLCITLVGMTILSTRAALFNIVVKPRKRKRREREFQEYKEFMKQYYDTSNWELDPRHKGDNQTLIVAADTFETEETAKISPTWSDGQLDKEEGSCDDNVSVQLDDWHKHGEKVWQVEDDSDYSSEVSEEEQPSILSLSFVSDVVRKLSRKKHEQCQHDQKGPSAAELDPSQLRTPKEDTAPSGWTSFFSFTTPNNRKKLTLQDLLLVDYGDPDGSFIQDSIDFRSCASSVTNTPLRQQQRHTASARQNVLRLGTLLPQDQDFESDLESIFTSNEAEEEMKPLTPSPHRSTDTFAPRKALTSLARTIGGTKL